MTNQNLERDCARFGFSLTKKARDLVSKLSKSDKAKIVNTITKAIGILSTDGPFAYIVWLEYKGSLNPTADDLEEMVAQKVHQKSFELLKYENFIKNVDDYDYKRLKAIFVGEDKTAGICKDIYQMFFVKSILEKMLTYALYKAKSLQVDEQPAAESDIAEGAME